MSESAQKPTSPTGAAPPEYKIEVYNTGFVIDPATGEVLTGDRIPAEVRARWDRAFKKAFAQSH